MDNHRTSVVFAAAINTRYCILYLIKKLLLLRFGSALDIAFGVKFILAFIMAPYDPPFLLCARCECSDLITSLSVFCFELCNLSIYCG